MKNLLCTVFTLFVSFALAQKVEYNPHRDPIPKEEKTVHYQIPPAGRIIRLDHNHDSAKRPLIIINSEPVSDQEFGALDQEKIKEIKVLKRDEAIALYGARGVNGVILIKTKRNWKLKKKPAPQQEIIAI